MLVLVYFCMEFNIKCVCLCVGTTMRKMEKKPLLVRITPQCCRISAAANRQSSHTHETHTAFSLSANSRASTHSEHKHCPSMTEALNISQNTRQLEMSSIISQIMNCTWTTMYYMLICVFLWRALFVSGCKINKMFSFSYLFECVLDF